MYYQVLSYVNTVRMDMLILQVLTVIDSLQHRSPKYFVSRVPFIYCLLL